jgi:putative serine/threonine protein kinase
LSQQNTTFTGEFDLDSPELAVLISYPHFSEAGYSQRIREMKSLGIQVLMIGNGKSTIGGLSICGKGCVGLVLRARNPEGQIALKIRRVDADRSSMEREADFHRIANSAGIGPRYLGHTENLIMMEFISGQNIIEWVRTANREQFRKVARSILDQCFLLDRIGLDHGELSRLGRHVIVSDEGQPCIIDFESASTSRKTINVTSAAQSLFLHGSVAVHAKKIYGQVDAERVIASLRKYKRLRSEQSYDELVSLLAL